MKIGLLGQFGSGNSGNDGSLEAMVRFLRREFPEAQLLCICSNAAYVARKQSIEATSISGMPPQGRAFTAWDRFFLGIPRRAVTLAAAFRKTRGLDWIIVPGTGILDDYRDNPFNWPFVLLRWFVAARLNGVRIALVSVGAGPIKHPLSRKFMKWAAVLATYRSYRDQISRDFMVGLGLNRPDDRIYPDLAFGLPVPRSRGLLPGRSLTVGVGVMAYSGWSKKGANQAAIYRSYLTKLARFVSRLIEEGHRVRLLTGDAEDGKAVDDLLRRLDEIGPKRLHAYISAESATSLSELMRQMQETDIVVGSRYHNVVCALKLGRPVISLSYAAKNDALLSSVGLHRFRQHIETFDVDTLLAQFYAVVAEREVLGERLCQGMRGMIDAIARQEAVLAATIRGNGVPEWRDAPQHGDGPALLCPQAAGASEQGDTRA